MMLGALDDLRHHVANETMIRMTRSALGTEGDHGGGLDVRDEVRQLRAQPSKGRERREPAVFQSE